MANRSDRRGEVNMEALAAERLSEEVLNGINQIECGAKIEIKQGRLELGGWVKGPIKYLIIVAITILVMSRYNGDINPILKLIQQLIT